MIKQVLKYFSFSLAAVLIILTLAVVSIPYTAPPILSKLANEHHISLTVDNIRLSPLTGKLSISNIEAISLSANSKADNQNVTADALNIQQG